MTDHAYERLQCTVRVSRVPDEKPSIYGPKRLNIKIPDVSITVWIDEQSKNSWTAGFPGYRLRDAFAKATNKEALVQELKERWIKVGSLEPR